MQNDVPDFVKHLWAAHVLNDQNRLELLHFKESQLNKEIRDHLKTVHCKNHGRLE